MRGWVCEEWFGETRRFGCVKRMCGLSWGVCVKKVDGLSSRDGCVKSGLDYHESMGVWRRWVDYNEGMGVRRGCVYYHEGVCEDGVCITMKGCMSEKGGWIIIKVCVCVKRVGRLSWRCVCVYVQRVDALSWRSWCKKNVGALGRGCEDGTWVIYTCVGGGSDSATNWNITKVGGAR